jgi:hypothetical protein
MRNKANMSLIGNDNKAKQNLLLLVDIKRQETGQDAKDISRRSHVSLSVRVDEVIVAGQVSNLAAQKSEILSSIFDRQSFAIK